MARAPNTTTETISVRMHRGLLGDCFLISHRIKTGRPGEKDRAFHALIDCGVLQCIGAQKPETAKGADNIKAAIASLREATKDETGRGKLDLVIGTHEHYDHLSGFVIDHATFRDHFTIGEVWLAWTEDPEDEDAKDIRARGKKALSTLKAIVERPAFGVDREARDRLATIQDLLQFYDDDIEPWDPAPADGLGADRKPKPKPRPYDPETQAPRSIANAIAWLVHKAKGNVKYLEPGQVVRFGLDDRLKAIVLGPPRIGKFLAQLNPSGGGDREVYLVKPGDAVPLDQRLRLDDAAQSGSVATVLSPGDFPFPMRFLRREAAEPEHLTERLYRDKDASRRRIDGEWLDSAEHLALKIDGDVNNTSLALAIEAPETRQVLLFPADAQVGNWLSWHEQAYPKTFTRAEKVETAQQILSRVVLYKVGHHGSHNATARDKGLEMMTSPDLVAMIPVVESVAGEQKTRHNPAGWAMPFGALERRLVELTDGRILQGDGAPALERAAFTAKPSVFELSYDEAKPDDPAWVELTLPIPPA